MISYEYAVYYKLLLLCGYTEELRDYIDTALVEQNPISDVVLELSTAGSDDKRLLTVLNEYLSNVQDSDIDYDSEVFELVMSFFRKKYVEEAASMAEVAALMYQMAVHTGRYLEEPWYTMYFMGDMLEEADNGYIDKKDYQRRFHAFVCESICLRDQRDCPKKRLSIGQWIRRMTSR